MRVAILLGSLLISVNLSAQTVMRDTGRADYIDTLKKDLLTAPDTVRQLHSKLGALIPPAAMVAYGAASFYAKPLRRFDQYIYREADEHNFSTRATIEDYFQVAPVVMVYGLNLAGVHGKNTFIDRTMLLLLSEGMMNLAVMGLKHSTHRLRPNGADRYSFPSGHTANAFLTAEFMAQEFGDRSPYYTVAGYAFATTTGAFRIYHRDHWFSDVIAGAGFGILATKGAYLLYPHIRKLFVKPERTINTDVPVKHDERSSSSLVMPSFSNGTFGLTYVASF